MDRAEFIKQFTEIKDTGIALARLQEQARGSSYYPDDEMGMYVTEHGMSFYEMVPIPYETGDTYHMIFVPWEDFDNIKETEKRYRNVIAAKKREDAKRADEWGRRQYEELRKKYGD